MLQWCVWFGFVRSMLWHSCCYVCLKGKQKLLDTSPESPVITILINEQQSSHLASATQGNKVLFAARATAVVDVKLVPTCKFTVDFDEALCNARAAQKDIPFCRVRAAPACVAVLASIRILHSASDIGDEHHGPFSQTQSSRVIHVTTKTAVCPDRHVIPNDTKEDNACW